jgi:hypothetical protein
MGGAINGAHPATAETVIQSILTIEDPTQERIKRDIREGRVGLQRRVIVWAHQDLVGKLPAASWALEHILAESSRETLHYRKPFMFLTGAGGQTQSVRLPGTFGADSAR